MENGARFRAKVFADCSYEGDLMAQAGVGAIPTAGRAPRSTASRWRGSAPTPGSCQFAVDIPAKDESGKLLPEVQAEPRGEPGSADKRIQAYNFRVIATNVAANRIPWPKPAGDDPKRYELLARYLPAMTKYMGRSLTINEANLLRVIPNGKADFNNRGAFSTDYIGKNYGYPEGSYAERARIWQDHIDYQQGYYYFLANDPRVPRPLQEEMRQWGLAKDEFTDTNNWPNQLYVREACCMVGFFVASQKDLQTQRTKSDVIGMGSYNSDSHNVQRHITPEGIVLNEGNVEVAVQPYQIPYRGAAAEAGGSREPSGAGVLFGQSRRLLQPAHGTAVYDPGPCGRRGSGNGCAEGHRCAIGIRGGFAENSTGRRRSLRARRRDSTQSAGPHPCALPAATAASQARTLGPSRTQEVTGGNHHHVISIHRHDAGVRGAVCSPAAV